MESRTTPVNFLKEMPKRVPVNGTFELTVRCNLHCKMCLFRHDDSENRELMANELTAEQWIDMARQVAEAGTMSLLITGGEPMLRPDFCEIWEGIYKQGFVITLYTNATLVTPKIMETLRKYPPHKIGITIYGACPETYEKVCGNADSYNQALNGIDQLNTLPSLIEYRMTVIQDNLQESHAVTKMVRERFSSDASVIHDTTVIQSVRGACADVSSCRLTPEQEEERKYEHILDIMRKQIGEPFDPAKVYYWEKNEAKSGPGCKTEPFRYLFGCNAGVNQYTITWDGKLQGCQLMGVFFTDAATEGFQSAWKRFPEMVKLPPVSEKCRRCSIADYCDSCYATRYAETGSLNGCSDYLYNTAYVRRKFKEKFRRNEV